MLEMKIPESEYFDEKTYKLFRLPEVVLHLEHSLLSVSKWETLWETPFLSDTKKTPEQLISYVGLMSVTPIKDTELARFGPKQYQELNNYLNAKHSATWFSDENQKGSSRQPVTSELIYYWMTAFNIPFECQTWPFSRLMNLIKIAQIKPKQPMVRRTTGRSLTCSANERPSTLSVEPTCKVRGSRGYCKTVDDRAMGPDLRVERSYAASVFDRCRSRDVIHRLGRGPLVRTCFSQSESRRGRDQKAVHRRSSVSRRYRPHRLRGVGRGLHLPRCI